MADRITWQRYLFGALAACALAGPLGTAALVVVVSACGVASIAAIISGVARYGPEDRLVWGLFAAGLVGYLTAGIAHEIHGGTFGSVSENYPALPDFIDLVAFVIAAAGAYRLARRRVAADPTVLVDSLIVTAAIAVIVWAYVIIPDIRSAELGTSGKALNVAFSLVTLVLLGAISRVAIGSGARNASYYLLAAFAGAVLFGDVLATAGMSQEILLLAAAVALVLVGSAALHPGMAELSQPSDEPIARMTTTRTIALAVAALVPPAVLIAEGERLTSRFGIAITLCWLGISMLVIVRLGGLVRARERVAELERILAKTSSSLASATDQDLMYRAMIDGVEPVLGHAGMRRASVLELNRGGWRTRASSDASRIGSTVELTERIEQVVLSGGPVQVRNHRPLDGEGREVPVIVILPLVASRQVRGAVVLSCETQPRRDELAALQSLSLNAALALEASRLAEQVLRRRSERRFRSLIDSSNDIIAVLADNGVATFISPAGPRLLERAEADFGEVRFREFVDPIDRGRFDQLVRDLSPGVVELRFIADDPEPLWFEVGIDDLRHEPDVEGLVVTAREISQRKRAEEQVISNEARFRSLVQHSSDLVCVFDPSGVFEWVSPSVRRLLGYHPDELLGVNAIQFIGDPSLYGIAQHSIGSEDRPPRPFEMQMQTKSGESKIIDVTVTDLTNDPSVGGIVVNAHDVTDRRQLEESLRHQALHDDLTGIANRVLFRDRVDQALNRRESTDVAVLLIDLDDFKTVNDGLGHQVGDELLKVISFRLQHFLRSGDTPARLGGDEFGVLVDGVQSAEDVLGMTERLHSVLVAPIDMEEHDLEVRCSIGLVFAGEISDASADVMLQAADVAMYEAKKKGKDRTVVFDSGMGGSAFERLELRSALSHALSEGQLDLWYQPIVDLESGAVEGFEALLRWNHPERGLISPALFIPLAEETGEIVPIGRWVVQEAVAQLAEWRAQWKLDLSMEVNVSARQAEDADFITFLADVLDSTGVPAAKVVLELTESMEFADPVAATSWLEELRALGPELYADDFGAGYASYAMLQRLPFTGVKLDMSLIEDIDEGDTRSLAQVGAIVDMARRSGLDVVAEGIETAQQLRALVRLGCERGQGYYFGRPALPDNHVALLKSSQRGSLSQL